MVEVIFDPDFRKDFKKIKNRDIKDKVIKQILKIRNNPDIGKPMMYYRKGTRELYIAPYRLSYKVEGEKVHILALYHKNSQ